jgi:general secretion pathway protein A
MYERFFGLVDAPFRLTPDPRYLFLSRKHAEALAHLRLGLSESSGFVCITGDVGTGKTTLLRGFLAGLGPEYSTAYVFNPSLSALELLQTINAELGLPAASTSKKALTDALNAHLLGQREAGHRSVVVIDEAQALSIDVLEQLRLLSNLETTTEKLLRIILVGQPQLRGLLLHPELVQLNQRITLRWHMEPFSHRETVAYVRHRLAVASGGQARCVFTRAALWHVHRGSHGVPRLINMIAHRALLAAFAADRHTVTARTVLTAHREIGTVPLTASGAPVRRPRRVAWVAAGLAVGVGIATVGLPRLPHLAALGLGVPEEPPSAAVHDEVETAGGTTPDAIVADPAPEAVAAAAVTGDPADGPPESAEARADAGGAPGEAPDGIAEPAPTEVAALPPPAEDVAGAASADEPPAAPTAAASPALAPPVAEPRLESPVDPQVELEGRLAVLEPTAAARTAVGALLAAWRVRPLDPGESVAPDDLPAVAARRGLEHLAIRGNGSMLRVLDLPTILELRLPETGEPRLVALTGMRDGRATLVVGEHRAPVGPPFLERHWFGQAHLFWRDFEALGVTFGRDARGAPVSRLQELLRRAGVYGGPVTGVYDGATATAVLDFQRSRYLVADGLVGRLTRIVLYAAVGGYARPTLQDTTS